MHNADEAAQSNQQPSISLSQLYLSAVIFVILFVFSQYALFQLENLEKNLSKAFGRSIKKEEDKLLHLEVVIKQLDPQGLLLKGYSRTESQGKPIHLIDLKVGDELITYTSDQKLSSTLTKIEKK